MRLLFICTKQRRALPMERYIDIPVPVRKQRTAVPLSLRISGELGVSIEVLQRCLQVIAIAVVVPFVSVPLNTQLAVPPAVVCTICTRQRAEAERIS